MCVYSSSLPICGHLTGEISGPLGDVRKRYCLEFLRNSTWHELEPEVRVFDGYALICDRRLHRRPCNGWLKIRGPLRINYPRAASQKRNVLDSEDFRFGGSCENSLQGCCSRMARMATPLLWKWTLNLLEMLSFKPITWQWLFSGTPHDCSGSKRSTTEIHRLVEGEITEDWITLTLPMCFLASSFFPLPLTIYFLVSFESRGLPSEA